MDLLEAMEKRHSVRSYEDKRIVGDVKEKLLQFIDSCNKESGLHMQLVLDEPQAFSGFMAHYGKLYGVKNYIALIGKKDSSLDEACGYYGEKVVLYAQALGLNTCWVALTYSKKKSVFTINEGEELCCVIAIGYGKNQGVPHKSKSIEKVTKVNGPMPDWFRKGVEAALLAPTAINQQKFQFTLNENKVSAKAGIGFCSRIDLGIVKYHFELGAYVKNFVWS